MKRFSGFWQVADVYECTQASEARATYRIRKTGNKHIFSIRESQTLLVIIFANPLNNFYGLMLTERGAYRYTKISLGIRLLHGFTFTLLEINMRVREIRVKHYW